MSKLLSIQAVAALLLSVYGAEAATHRVPSEYPTIRDGLNACAPGDTVLVAPGIYTGTDNRSLALPRFDLVLVSESGSEATIIDCQGSENDYYAVFYLRGSHTSRTVIEGFTIRNNYSWGGACLIDNGDCPVIRDCRFEDCYGYEDGSGITCAGAFTRPLITTCAFRNNIARDGAAIACVYDAAPEISDCEFVDNQSPNAFYGAILCNGTAEGLLIRGCVFRGNLGGGISGYLAYLATVEDCQFYGNTGYDGGAVYWDGRLRIRGCTIVGNSTRSFGGGISFRGSLLEIERSILWGNCAPTGSDLYCSHGTVRFTCSAFDDSGLHAGPEGEIQFNGPQVRSDPRFCDGRTCQPGATGDDCSLRSDSPCLLEFSPCQEQIGALGLGCQAPEPVGACCLGGPGGTCSLLTAGDCATQEGNYMGDGVSCYPDPCVPIAVETTTWGRIKAKFSR